MPDFLHTLTKSGSALEPALGNPSSNGYLLSSTTAGVRSWVAPSAGTLSGSGTSGRITQWTGANTIGDSNLTGPASNALALEASSNGLTLTVPATGTAALLATNNLFTVRQDIGGSGSGWSSGLYVFGDSSLSAAVFRGFSRAGIESYSSSNTGVYAESSSGTALFAVSGSSTAGFFRTSNAGSSVSCLLTETRSGTGDETTVAKSFVFAHNSTSTPAAGFGTQVIGQSRSTTTDYREQGGISFTWVDATDATRKARMTLTAYDANGSREGLRVEANGSNPLIGFLGASAVARPAVTGDRENNAALASMISALASEGLVTDSTTSATPTYTPTYVGGTSAGTTTYTSQTGVYRQIGNIVFFSAKVVWTAASGTGNARVSLPSTAANVSNQEFAVSVYHTLVTFANGSVVGRIQPNTAYIEFLSPATNAAGTAIAVEAAGTIVVSGFYLV
jgi:hypothetical protein